MAAPWEWGRQMAAKSRQINAPAPFDPFTDVKQAQTLTKEGVQANAELLRPELMARIGDTLGGLNSIGALRSGGTKVALDDINRDFTDRIGAISSAATTGAIGAGLDASSLRLQKSGQDIERERIKAQKKASLLGAIGSVVGAGLGFALGGPVGAGVGAKVGGAAAGHDGSVGT